MTYYRLIQDNDCHWYVIRIKQETEFYDWLSNAESDNPKKWEGHDFDDNRVDGPHRIFFKEWIDEQDDN